MYFAGKLVYLIVRASNQLVVTSSLHVLPSLCMLYFGHTITFELINLAR